MLTASIATAWNVEPLQLVPTLLAAFAYFRRAQTLKRRGQPVPGWRQFLFWLGIGLASKVALSFILVAVLIFFTVFSGIRQVDRKLVERVVTLGGSRWSLVRHVYLPSVTAWILSNLKVAVGFAFTGACVGEFVAATRGLGYLLSFAQSTYNAALMFALIFLIMVVVLVIFAIAGRLEKYLLRWN